MSALSIEIGKKDRFAGDHKLFLLNGASRSWEFGYLEELQKFAQEVPWFEYVPTVSRPWDDEKWTGETGRVDDILRKYTDMWGLGTNAVAYLCGHPAMVEGSKGILKRIGFTKEGLKEEIYWVPSKKDACSLKVVDSVLNTHAGTAAFEEKNISPSPVSLAKLLPPSDFSKSAGLVQRDAGNILRKDARLQRPYAATLGPLDQRLEEHPTNSATLRVGRYINRNLRHSGVDVTARHWT